MTSENPIRYEPSPKRVRVVFNDATVADSVNVGLLLEHGHPPVYYFPRADVRMELLRRTEHRTHCPYKGDASYWTLEVCDLSAVDAVWSYETPHASMSQIEGMLAFYWRRVDRGSRRTKRFSGIRATRTIGSMCAGVPARSA